MKTNVLKTELTPAQILNPELNGDYCLEGLANNLESFCPLLHLLKLEINDYIHQSLNDYQLGMLEYITPHIEQILTQTNIADYLELISIDTKEQDYEGVHIWTFALKDPYAPEKDPTLINTLTNHFNEVFPYDSQISLHSPIIQFFSDLFVVIIPYTC